MEMTTNPVRVGWDGSFCGDGWDWMISIYVTMQTSAIIQS